MTHERLVANSILGRLKDGEEFSQSVIRLALTDTGDLAPERRTGVGQALQEEDQGGGESRSLCLVAQDLLRRSEKTWTSRR